MKYKKTEYAVILLFIIGVIFFLKFVNHKSIGKLNSYKISLTKLEIQKKIKSLSNNDLKLDIIDSNHYFNILKKDSTMEVNSNMKSFYTNYEYLSVKERENRLVFRYKIIQEEGFSTVNLISISIHDDKYNFKKNGTSSNEKKYISIFKNRIVSPCCSIAKNSATDSVSLVGTKRVKQSYFNTK